ncbi:MAG TPA: hypothetical protein VIJ04_11425 [Xanthobacteraceae bacterium]
MRSAGNFHPEWGYIAPAPGFMRMVRIALVATAIGAVAGAVVVVSLIERPGSNDNAIAAHALLTRAPVIASPAVVTRAAAPVAVKSAHPQAQLSMATTTPAPAAAVPTAAVTQSQNASIADKRGSAGSISPPLPLPAPTDATVAANGPVMDPVRVPAEADVAVAPATVAEPRAPAKRSALKKRRYDAYRNEPYRRQEATGNRWHDNGGFAPLFRLFSFRSGSPYSSN